MITLIVISSAKLRKTSELKLRELLRQLRTFQIEQEKLLRTSLSARILRQLLRQLRTFQME